MRTLIVGGGLSGLALAEMLEARGRDYSVVEARARFGGRIETVQHGAGYFDLGPAWYWPGQPRMAALVGRLQLGRFDQYASGAQLFEDAQGHVQRVQGFASMQGSWRVKGGLAAVTQALADRLPDDRKRLNTRIEGLTRTDTGVIAKLDTGDTLSADRVVLALPPRIASGIAFHPTLPASARDMMRRTATWMAGQAKAVALYDRPFWREDGLSGDAMSRHGPMVELHDASPADGGPFGLFGFIGIAPDARRDTRMLRRHLRVQFGRLFGPKAAEPLQLYLKDWAFDPLTATLADQAPLTAHPVYGLQDGLRGLWGGRLHLGGTETAPQFGGYLEGALEAAENALDALERDEHVG